MEDVKRLPFANYDILVYLGIGILALPLVRESMLVPLGLHLPNLTPTTDSEFVSAAFQTLYLLFAGYAVGHVLAYLSSYFVERFVHEWLRYPSDVWLSLGNRKGASPFELFNSNIQTTPISVASLVTGIFHFPLWPGYALIHASGSFGFYTPKLDTAFLPLLREKVARLKFPTPVTHRSNWPKSLEHYVSNNSALGYSRIYNYLVIFGVLRSLSFILILIAWARLLSLFVDVQRGPDKAVIGLATKAASNADIVSYFALAAFAALTVMAFGKFNRRFFEECVYSFILSDVREQEQSLVMPRQ